jgi:predicted MFS family arabinose efflux permease
VPDHIDKITKPTKKAGSKILLLAVGLLIVIMAFTGVLNHMTFVDNYNKSLVNTYSVAGNELVRKIEYALNYGKSIDNFYGMSETLQELKEIVDDVEQINIISPDGEIFYNLQGFVTNEKIHEKLLKTSVFEQGKVNENTSYQSYKGKHHIFLKIHGTESEHVAALEMVFTGDDFLGFNNKYIKQLAIYAAGISLIALFLLYIIILRTRFITKDSEINRKRILIILIIVLGSVQLLYCGIVYNLFKNSYWDLALQSKSFVENTVAKNIENVYQKGIALKDVDGVEEYLENIKDGLPLLEKLDVIEDGTAEEGILVESGDYQEKVLVSARISGVFIERLMFRFLLDMLTVWIISIFFMIELTLLSVILMSKDKVRKDIRNAGRKSTYGSGLIRGLIFIVNICVFMSITFVPIVMQNLYQPILGLPSNVVLGLPISAEMLGGILAIIVAGWLIDKKGWRVIFYTGALFLAIGNLFSGLSFNAVFFILSRAIAGLGVGLILMTLRSLAVSLPEKKIAIAEFTAGSIAGLNCGAVIGGMLADRIGYNAVFCFSAIMVIFSFVYVYKFLADFTVGHRITSEISAWKKLTNFITDKSALLFLLLIFLPILAAGAFLDYCFPLFAKGHNLSQSDISRAFLLNGLCIIYLGPLLTKNITRYLGDKKGIVLSLVIVISALLVFVAFGTISAAFIAVVLLGVADSFGVATQTSYFLNLRTVQDLEINKAMAYFSMLVNLGKMLGPIIFGFALSVGIRMGVGLITGILIIFLMVFIIVLKYSTVRISSENNMNS